MFSRKKPDANLHLLRLCLVLLCADHIFGCDLNATRKPDTILCRECGANIAVPSTLQFLSPSTSQAKKKSFKTLFGGDLVQVLSLANPLGIEFEIITVKQSDCFGIGSWHSEASWFPSFAWKVCICISCGTHMGWIFKPVETASETNLTENEGFYGLILSKTISERYADSLIATPRSYL